MLRRIAICGASGFFVLFAACNARAGSVTDPYIGYTVPSTGGGDNAYDNGLQITNTATQAQTNFLSQLSGYYYEDFQELGTPTKNSQDKVAINGTTGYGLSFNSYGNVISPPPTGTLTSNDSVSNGNYNDLNFQYGPISGQRGTYTGTDINNNPYNLASAVPGGPTTDANNWYVDIQASDSTSPTVTLQFSPGQDAVGLMLNDIVTPHKAEVTVNFQDGSSMELTDGITAGTGSGNNPYTNGTLANNNVMFFGYIGDEAINTVTINTGTDPITLDNIYLSNAVPLPATGSTGLALLCLVGIARFGRKMIPA